MLHTPPVEYRHFSAEIRLELHADNRTFELASVSPNEIILRDSHEISVCDAEVIMFIDGEEFRWPVRLPHGAVPFATEVYTVPRGSMVKITGDPQSPSGLMFSA